MVAVIIMLTFLLIWGQVKMSNKGFISISVIYSFFLVFLMLLLFIVNGYVNNRTLLKKIENEIIDNSASFEHCELYPNTIRCLYMRII